MTTLRRAAKETILNRKASGQQIDRPSPLRISNSLSGEVKVTSAFGPGGPSGRCLTLVSVA